MAITENTKFSLTVVGMTLTIAVFIFDLRSDNRVQASQLTNQQLQMEKMEREHDQLEKEVRDSLKTLVDNSNQMKLDFEVLKTELKRK